MPGNFIDYMALTAEYIGLQILAPPTNKNTSIQYLLFTADNPSDPCFIEPTNKYINQCKLNEKFRTILLIHGYVTLLKPGNLFEKIKDSLLTSGKYNVIIVDWSKYNYPYILAVANAYVVGVKIGEMITFLVENKGINPKNIHLIGHSLGAHVAGVAGKQVSKLGRITGSDPAAPLYLLREKLNRLDHTDAEFVDVIHSSSLNDGNGLGINEPIGDIDFYPNGGIQQTACKIGGNYTSADGDIAQIESSMDMIFCNHGMSLLYFLYSIQNCNYLSKQCTSYQEYELHNCSSKSPISNKMGLHANPISSLPPKSKFYLKTAAYYPFCETK
ncbi:hypothetical protein TNCV_1046361 [Trichonephila clavipes]|nr:hypothetical protein TNCV_1046361 [Trichonephila clavipes]